MAKEKDKGESVLTVLDNSELLNKSILAEYGENSVVYGGDILDENTRIVSLSPKLDMIMGGVPDGTWMTLTGQSGCGKEQPLDAIVYTNMGPITMGDIQLNDSVCTPFGSYARVIGIYPQGDKLIYRITFKDGDTVDCGAEHLWMVRTNTSKIYKLITTEEMLQYKKVYIAVPNYVEFKTKDLSIEPYLFGLLLGDGSFVNSNIKFSNIDKSIIDYVRMAITDQCILVPINKIDYRIKNAKRNNKPTWLKTAIQNLGLYKKLSKYKFIPDCYQINSYDNRLALIQGLMDTDGSISKNGWCEYTTTSLQMAKDIKFLINSIGGICVYRKRITKCNHKFFSSYRCAIRIHDTSILFRLNRKKIRSVKRTKYKDLVRSVLKIEPVGTKPAQCIKIDNDNGLYITDNCIVTHNTTLALHYAAKCQKPEYGGRTVYYIDIEGRLKKVNLRGIPGLDMSKFHVIRSHKKKILTGQQYLKIAEDILRAMSNCVLILDSYSALCHENELTADPGTSTRGMGGYTLLSQFCRQMCNIVPVMKSNVVGITHLMANVGSPHGGLMEKSGTSLTFHADIRLKAKKVEPWKAGEKLIGQVVTWSCLKSATGASGGEIESYIRYGKGVDEFYELFTLASDIGLIEVSKQGGWHTLVFNENQKIQGAENAYKHVMDNPLLLKKLQDTVKATYES